ncbi:hypothetical protein KY285_023830 [Solanum tuberosum]|nr:hypothetical protein KY289_025763 [Solanum tuberosum]KAH0676029.1 hypothetical protein KY285_023830 [Solanum tuberosum]
MKQNSEVQCINETCILWTEGCIAEGHIAEKTLTFCSWYIEDIETRFNRPRRVRDEPTDMPSGMSSLFPQLGKPASASENFPLNPMQKLQAHRYILLNCAIVTPFVDEFREYIKKSSRGRRPSPTEIERRVNKEFVDWFQKRIMNQDTIDTMSIDLKFLARGPSVNARRVTAYNINGSKFRTLAREEGLKTQNSGVFLTSKTSCVASSVDGNLRQAELPYYGKLEDIIEINYNGRFKVVLFKCQWADTTRDRGYQKDRWNFNYVNFDRLIHTGEREEHEPYIEASQAQTVYSVDDIVNKGWSVAVHLKPRDLYDMGEVMEEQIRSPFPWRHYFQNTHRLIFVVDRNDNDHVVEARDKLHRVLNEVSTFCFISPGPVHKKDVMKASVMLEKKKEYATILAFDVKVTQEAWELSDEHED